MQYNPVGGGGGDGVDGDGGGGGGGGGAGEDAKLMPRGRRSVIPHSLFVEAFFSGLAVSLFSIPTEPGVSLAA